ncbi:MAG: hypothetical protein M3285_12640 [Actinomycetota bacterium]|nr:hypothetical protein [Actinomycetota bacterium]MDQ3956384.1 hypothetical protein [Actinomycetota bacterium]
MDARLVWDTWRRILKDDDLVEWLTHPGGADAAAVAGLNAAEKEVLAEYARTPQATDTNIGMYRRGLVRNALAALSRVPLSQHLLYMSELDVDAVAADFARVNGYADDGPNFWRLAGAFVDYLSTRPEFAAAAHQDVLALDRALVALARRLGATAVSLWPDTGARDARAAARPDLPPSRFVASPAGIVVASRHDLTPWIENPQGYDPSETLESSPRRWLIYFPVAESEPAYAELSERSARIFDLLATSKAAADVARALDSLSADEALTVIEGLAELGVVVGEGAGLSDRSDAVAPSMNSA